MRASVIIRSKDEAERLRLTLTSLQRQAHEAEIVVVDDGSRDMTTAVLAEASAWFPLRILRHPDARGRSAASNAGAQLAAGDVLIFLDGDTLAGKDLVARHVALHASNPHAMGRGETYHIRRANVAPISRELILEDFARVDASSAPGVYPGTAAARLYQLEMDALRQHPQSRVLWAAASGSNFSVGRTAFLDAGGFLEALDLNEHRELALRLCAAGLRMLPAEGARSYHLISGPRRDPLVDRTWEDVFYRAHPIPELKRLIEFWTALAEGRDPGRLVDLENAATQC